MPKYPLRAVVSRHYDKESQRYWELLECGHLFGKYTLASGKVCFSTVASRKATKRRCNFCKE